MYDIYEINNNNITPDDVEMINKNASRMFLIDIKDTKNLSSELLSKIDDKVKIHITGPLFLENITKTNILNVIFMIFVK